ncbi:hypothetical protein ACFL5Q_04225 [Planctomycetota bacterium]
MRRHVVPQHRPMEPMDMCALKCVSVLRSGLGWLPDIPDDRDFTLESDPVKRLLRMLSRPTLGTASGKAEFDLREYFLEPEDQCGQNCSPVFACAGLVEYFQARSVGEHVRLAKPFLYHNAKRVQRIEGDCGVGIRATWKALVRSGAPPEELCLGSKPGRMAQEQDPFLFSYAPEYREMAYFRLDDRNVAGDAALRRIKAFLAAGFPCVLGFPVPPLLPVDPVIPFRFDGNVSCGGQAVIAVGYNDGLCYSVKGALVIRNSWGTGWGIDGYGYLPYDYVTRRLATDVWTILRKDWIVSGDFGLPLLDEVL